MKAISFWIIVLCIGLYSCGSADRYFTIVNRSSTKVKVEYMSQEVGGAYFFELPKLADINENNELQQPFEELTPEKTGPINLIEIPQNKALVLGKIDKKQSQRLKIGREDSRFNLTMLKIQSRGGTVMREGESIKNLFHRNRKKNYSILIKL